MCFFWEGGRGKGRLVQAMGASIFSLTHWADWRWTVLLFSSSLLRGRLPSYGTMASWS